MFYCSIAFKTFKRSLYLADGCELRGGQSALVRTLQRIGYDVIPVNVASFEQLPESDRPSYLLKLIGQKRRIC